MLKDTHERANSNCSGNPHRNNSLGNNHGISVVETEKRRKSTRGKLFRFFRAWNLLATDRDCIHNQRLTHRLYVFYFGSSIPHGWSRKKRYMEERLTDF